MRGRSVQTDTQNIFSLRNVLVQKHLYFQGFALSPGKEIRGRRQQLNQLTWARDNWGNLWWIFRPTGHGECVYTYS